MWYLYFRKAALSVFAVFFSISMLFFLVIWNTFPVQADAKKEELKFPFLIEGTDLIAEYFVSYEGDFFEDKSGEFMIDAAALCIYNRGDRYIEFASVYIETLDGVYCFEGTYILPHSKVVILEKYKSSYPTTPVYFAAGKTHVTEKQNGLDDLQINSVGIGQLEITNTSEKVLDDTLLYYKRYDSQWDIYIGGVTYAVSAGSLQPGQSTVIHPGNYADGYSKILYASCDARTPSQ